MPAMQMLRNWTVRSTTGHTIRFERNQITQVPDDPKLVEQCRAAGAVYVDKADPADLVDEGPTPTNLPKSPEERQQRILDLFGEMMTHQEEHREHFTAFGRPNARYVAQTLGFDISAKEVESLWLQAVAGNPDDA